MYRTPRVQHTEPSALLTPTTVEITSPHTIHSDTGTLPVIPGPAINESPLPVEEAPALSTGENSVSSPDFPNHVRRSVRDRAPRQVFQANLRGNTHAWTCHD